MPTSVNIGDSNASLLDLQLFASPERTGLVWLSASASQPSTLSVHASDLDINHVQWVAPVLLNDPFAGGFSFLTAAQQSNGGVAVAWHQVAANVSQRMIVLRPTLASWMRPLRLDASDEYGDVLALAPTEADEWVGVWQRRNGWAVDLLMTRLP
ncbi:MAG: hypothetical protein QM742_06565 [Aquabacterium sp.]